MKPDFRARTRRFALTILLAAAAAPAAAWEIRGDLTQEQFQAFHRRFSTAVYHYPRHGAAPLGLVGFEAYADSTYDPDFNEQELAGAALDGDLPGGFLGMARVGARKGLPGKIDIGASYGRALGGDFKLLSADLQWAILDGGVVSPALSLRFTGSRTMDAGAYDLDQYGAEVLLSKGFAVLTPYIGAGVVHSRGTLHGTLSSRRDEDTRGIAYAGATLNLLIPKITVELEQGEALQGSLRVGFGF